MIPRAAVLFTIAYGAGLATGLLRFGDLPGAITVLLIIALTSRPAAVLIALAALVGRLSGELAGVAERGRCDATLPEGRLALRVRVLEPVDAEGGRIAVRPLGAGCGGSVLARWPRGHPVRAGVEAPLTGSWMPRPGPGGRSSGTLLVREAGPATGSPGPGETLRTYLYGASRRLYGDRAGMVDALILGRRGGIDPDLQDRFAWSGLVHLLSISGFHVGLITAWVFLAGRLARLGRSSALVLAAGVSVAYVGFLGWPAPAGRAAALAVLAARCRVRQRHVLADPLLSATCLCVLLVDPWASLDLGGWLSASALWGATTFTRWSDRALGRHFMWRTLSSSVGATLATAPITAVALGTVAPVGILVNFAAIPLAGFAVPGVIASLLLLPLTPAVAGAMAAGAGFCLHLLELAAAAGAAVPHGHLLLEPGDTAQGVLWLAGLGAGLWAIGSGNTLAETGRRLAWVATGLLWAGLLRAVPVSSADGDRDLTLHFLDVGQGDAAAIRTPGGQWVLVDGGPAGRSADAGRRVVAPFLQRRGVRTLAAVVVSHAHADHIGGVPTVVRRVPPGLVIEPGAPVPDEGYLHFLDLLAGEGLRWHPGRTGECFRLDGVTFAILHPEPGWAGWGEDVNEDSLVLLVEYGAFQALFAGDAGFPAEEALEHRLPPVDLLKVGHHGSRGSTGDRWLERLRPRVAVISVGRNDYGHPAPETMARLEARRIAVRRTDRDGTVSVASDGRSMLVRSAGAAERFDVAAEPNFSPDSPQPAGASCRLP
ncbi:MAG TPA: ComEC/Rec2 family competence protein [Gemmatimonadales bacterium]|nr:ComEC/Rec2 family competence protein [Gemmatimonadales bacterium]